MLKLKRKNFENAKAVADQQSVLITAQIAVEVAAKNKEATITNAKAKSEATSTIAEGEAKAITEVGSAKAGVTLKVGQAEATVAKEKVAAMGETQYAIVQVANALATNHVKLVPEILVNSAGGNGSGNGLLDALLGAEILKNGILSKENKKADNKDQITNKEQTTDTTNQVTDTSSTTQEEEKK